MNQLARSLGVVAAAMALALSASSCSPTAGNPHGSPQSQKALMTPDQARQKLLTLLDDSMSDIKPPLKYWDAWPESSEQDGGYATAAQNRYIMTKVSKAKFGALLGLLERSWKAKGYSIESINPHQPAMFADIPGGSSVGITIGAADNIAFQVVVGPIPDLDSHDAFGIPSPQPTMSNGDPDMIPKYDDPFWSSDQPAATPSP
ncbi:hypothetical protein [Kitasatospora sp. MAA4]|uniref:hypothetical protein n=1 Tax=Kitasatospora sp. MAA4 TaxID=3035093 RepID=UPI0024731CED|nr:hypothetical protein [Kitasatospora sp. MAA4]